MKAIWKAKQIKTNLTKLNNNKIGLQSIQLVGILLFTSQGWAQSSREGVADLNCTSVKIQSTDPVSQISRSGNGFALSSDMLVVNDHSLGPSESQVTVVDQNQRSVKFVIENRDFHTDLAFLKVQGERLRPCNLQSPPIAYQALIGIVGYEKEDNEKFIFTGRVKNPKSQKIEIPGISNGIEIVGDGGGLPVRVSQSGSPVMMGSQVVGMLTQKTPEGTGLAIPSEQILEVFRQVKTGTLPTRPYSYDYRNSVIQFQGMEFGRQIQTLQNQTKQTQTQQTPNDLKSGNPHEGQSGSILGGGNQNMSLDEYELGFAIGNVFDWATLKKFQPSLAKALREAKATRVFITSIDGTPIRSFAAFVRVLGSCKACNVDGYWIESASPQDIQDPALRGVGLITKLVELLDGQKEQKVIWKVKPILERINQNLVEVSRLQNRGQRNLILEASNRALWSVVEEDLSTLFMKDSMLDVLQHLREVLW